MATNTIAWIVIAAVAVLLVIGLLAWVGRNRCNTRRHAEAEEIREQVRQEHTTVQRWEALADGRGWTRK